jgi:hypothetical protein
MVLYGMANFGKRYTEEQKNIAVNAYIGGSTLLESALLVGSNQQTVKNWLDSSGKGTRGVTGAHKLALSKGKGRFYGDETYDEIKRLYNSGLTSLKVSEELNVPWTMVQSAVKRFGISRSTSEAFLLSDLIGRPRKHTLNECIFDKVINENTAWVLGVVYGDGWIIRSKVGGALNGVGICGDYDVVEKILKIMGSDANIHKSGECYLAEMASGKLAKSIDKWGVVPNKHKILTWPDNLPRRLESHFLRGLWDSDGWICKEQISLGIGMTAKNIIDNISYRMGTMTGYIPKISIKKKEKDIHSDLFYTRLYRKRAILFGDWIWGESQESNRSNRKYEIFMRHKRESEMALLDPI